MNIFVIYYIHSSIQFLEQLFIRVTDSRCEKERVHGHPNSRPDFGLGRQNLNSGTCKVIRIYKIDLKNLHKLIKFL